MADRRGSRDSHRGDRGGHRGGRGGGGFKPSLPQPPKIPDNRIVKLVTNMYQVQLNNFFKQTWHRYEVIITNKYGEIQNLFDVKRELVAKLSLSFKSPFAFDGDHILYVAEQLQPISKLEVPKDFYVEYSQRIKFKSPTEAQLTLLSAGESDPNTLFYLIQSEDRRCYKVALRPVTFSEESRTQLLQTALSFSSYLSGNFVRGCSFFSLDNQKKLGNNWSKILFTGSYQSFRQCQIGTVINIDLSYHVSNWFGNLLQYISLLLDRSDWFDLVSKNEKVQNLINKSVKELACISNITKRKYKLSGIDFSKNCNNHFFEYEGKQVSVREYVLKRYQYKVKNPNLGLAFVTKMRNGEQDNVYLPLESLIVVQTRFQGELSSEDRKSMIDQSRCTPKDKLESIKNNLKNLIENQNWNRFDVKVDSSPIQVNSIILDPQPLLWGQGKTLTPDEEKGWIMNPMHTVVATKGVCWGLIWPAGENVDRVKTFAGDIVNAGVGLGFIIAKQPVQRQVESNDGNSYLKAIKSIWELPFHQRPLFTIILLNERDSERYKMIKNYTDVELGMINKCLVVNAPKKWNDFSILNNMLASINNRVNGKNWIVTPNQIKQHLGFTPDTKQESLCVLGMDVCHGGPSSGVDSTVALCSSRDLSFTKYHVAMGKQDPGTEIVEPQLMEQMMTEVLTKYRNHNKALPSRLLFYRDGVGEGQYQLVEQSELESIRKTIKQIYQLEKQPLLTYVIVQKRNHLRTFRPDESGNIFNPPVGTYISSEVVDTNYPNFFMYSHKAVIGTARPTHYQVILNEIKLDTKKLAEFTFALAHLHQGCTKSISVPAPALLAHKAAYRANAYFGKSTSAHPNVLDNGFMV
eukprot:TRINITY_DN5665_c1_g1_i1.p1 TRINITY_DN5665_c1_g1~~TRINITY_DN5665_c1_g1_i1.p1  ORF type:complete len:859 (+),score=221.64 TRINITY_DN5665_c1_g1_i1:88-2664(+)